LAATGDPKQKLNSLVFSFILLPEAMEDHPLLKIFEERKNEVLKVAAEKSAPRGRSSLT